MSLDQFIPLILTFTGFGLGYLSAWAGARHKVRRASMDSWRQASTYFKHRYQIQD